MTRDYRKIVLLPLLVLCGYLSAKAQYADDTLCFAIQLKADSTSLFYGKSSDNLNAVLSGPVFMGQNKLLFYSCNGYALYSENGQLLDSFSVMKENKKMSATDPRRIKFAFVLDTSTILFYRNSQDKKGTMEIFTKTLFKKGLNKIDNLAYDCLKEINVAQLFNLCNNCITNDMTSRVLLKSNLVGFVTPDGPVRLWALDKFYSYSSPLIRENNSAFETFFPGILRDQKTEIQKQLINPCGMFICDGRYYYCGLYSKPGTQENESRQKLFVCDQAGNLVFTHDFLKQVLVDAVLEYDKKANVNYTVQQPGEYVFSPVVNSKGDVYYGAIDFAKLNLFVKKRVLYHYTPVQVSIQGQELIDKQRSYVYKPMTFECGEEGNPTKVLPEIVFKDSNGKKRNALLHDLTYKGYFVRLCRENKSEIKKRLLQKCSSVPSSIKHFQDSLAALPNISCPFGITLENTYGTLASLLYDYKDTVLCARILAVTLTSEVVVRVDCVNSAEIVIFSADGRYNNRFTFNKQHYTKRKDIVGVSEDRQIVEEDYERITEDYTYYIWKRVKG